MEECNSGVGVPPTVIPRERSDRGNPAEGAYALCAILFEQIFCERIIAHGVRTHQASDIARLWQEFLSLLELIACIGCAVVEQKPMRGSWRYAYLRVAIATATVFAEKVNDTHSSREFPIKPPTLSLLCSSHYMRTCACAYEWFIHEL